MLDQACGVTYLPTLGSGRLSVQTGPSTEPELEGPFFVSVWNMRVSQVMTESVEILETFVLDDYWQVLFLFQT